MTALKMMAKIGIKIDVVKVRASLLIMSKRFDDGYFFEHAVDTIIFKYS